MSGTPTAPSPGPWRGYDSLLTATPCIVDAQGVTVAIFDAPGPSAERQAANRDAAVRAVNSHAALVAACEAVIEGDESVDVVRLACQALALAKPPG